MDDIKKFLDDNGILWRELDTRRAIQLNSHGAIGWNGGDRFRYTNLNGSDGIQEATRKELKEIIINDRFLDLIIDGVKK